MIPDPNAKMAHSIKKQSENPSEKSVETSNDNPQVFLTTEENQAQDRQYSKDSIDSDVSNVSVDAAEIKPADPTKAIDEIHKIDEIDAINTYGQADTSCCRQTKNESSRFHPAFNRSDGRKSSSDHPIFRVAISGGPCGGKTSAITYLADLLENLGYHVICVPETATALLSANIHPWDTPCFQDSVFSIQKTWEENALKQAILIEKTNKQTHCVILLDRGLMDGKAYCRPGDFERIQKEYGLSSEEILNRYDQIIYMVSAAIGAESYYGIASNIERMEEDIASAIEVENQTCKVWVNHPNLCVIDNSTGFDEKLRRCGLALLHELRKFEKKYKQ
ncbi:ATP/GTP-binding protein [Ileibacterium valens]|uniref:ATP/GTP-binding protein n=1 Tax=Ileibacterium valens TaxID=1862668 RepID=UPI00259B3954|nr:ATP-binding protein [Ileibacterium valens]